MSNIKVPTSQREDFKKYLATTGIQEKLVTLLVSLYEEPDKPGNPLEYIRTKFSAENENGPSLETLKQENADLKVKLGESEEKVKELEAKLSELQVAKAEEADAENAVEEKAE